MRQSIMKKSLALVLALVMVVGLVPFMPAVDAKADTVVTSFENVEAKAYTENLTIGAFTFTANADKAWTVDSNSKKSGDGEISFTKRIKSGGKSSDGIREIQFSTTGAAEVVVYMLSGKNTDETRGLKLVDKTTGDEIDTQLAIKDALPVEEGGTDHTLIPAQTFTVSEAGSYAFQVLTNSVNIYRMELITEGSTSTESGVASFTKNESNQWQLSIDGTESTATGVFTNSINNIDFYVTDGIIDNSFYGVVDGKYFANGINNKNFTGVVNVDGTFTYVESGLVSDFTGAVENAGKTWYFEEGVLVDLSFDGLKTAADGSVYYVKYGKVDTNRTGLVIDNGAFKYFKNGELQSAFTGIVTNAGAQWYIVNGVLAMVNTTFDDGEGNTYTITNGKVTDVEGM